MYALKPLLFLVRWVLPPHQGQKLHKEIQRFSRFPTHLTLRLAVRNLLQNPLALTKRICKHAVEELCQCPRIRDAVLVGIFLCNGEISDHSIGLFRYIQPENTFTDIRQRNAEKDLALGRMHHPIIAGLVFTDHSCRQRFAVAEIGIQTIPRTVLAVFQ